MGNIFQDIDFVVLLGQPLKIKDIFSGHGHAHGCEGVQDTHRSRMRLQDVDRGGGRPRGSDGTPVRSPMVRNRRGNTTRRVRGPRSRRRLPLIAGCPVPGQAPQRPGRAGSPCRGGGGPVRCRS